MSKYIEKCEKKTLNVVPLRGLVAFPNIPMSFELTIDSSISVCENAVKDESEVLLLAQRNPSDEKPDSKALYGVGCAAKIKQFLKLPDGGARIIADGTSRAEVLSYAAVEDGSTLRADVMCKTMVCEGDGGIKGEALILEVMDSFERFMSYLPKLSPELVMTVKSIKTPELLSDFIACNILVSFEDKQAVLETFEPLKRLEKLAVIMEREQNILSAEMQIHKKVRAQLEANQRDYYLREQLKAIQAELGDGGDSDSEINEYYDSIYQAKFPEEIQKKLLKEVKKLAKAPPASAESGVIKSYLDTCIEIPWSKTTKDRVDISAASKILEQDHDGLEKIKRRILEFLAVKQLNPHVSNQILCLVGPPGTGKTSIVASIARAMKRKYVRVSLGGIRDEADIRGHRKTYVGAMPGRIINALIQAKSRNPVMLLDEVDKLTRDSHGDPASALLEVLDGEQNKAFRDHYTELPIDLSECLFIATANTLETIPRPLIDRMEIIELQIYTRHEKLAIAKDHLLPKQLKRHGLNKRMVKLEDDAIYELIDFYTREAGVRNLEREIANLCRKSAMELLEKGEKTVRITAADVEKYLGKRKVKPESIAKENEVGVVNGLAYTELGGDLLKIEVAAMPGTGKLELTGSLGDVMKESAKAAITYIRSHAGKLGIDADFYKNKDIHIHVPEGAVPKDGPSAGVTIVTALASELSDTPVRRDIAMTGEITLRGNVLPIGGLREKTMAAYKAGIKTVCLPADNKDDLEEIDPVVKNGLEFIECSDVSQVLEAALVKNQIAPDAVTTVTVVAAPQTENKGI